MTTETVLLYPLHRGLELADDRDVTSRHATASPHLAVATGATKVSSDEDDIAALRIRDLVGLGALNLACLLAGLALGWFVDGRLLTTPAFTLVGLACGIAAGIWVSWLRVRQFLRS